MVLLKPGRAVAPVQADGQRLDAGPQAGHLSLGAAFPRLQFGDPLVGQPQRGDRPVVLFVEPRLAGVEGAYPALHGLELGVGLLRPGCGLLDAGGRPRHAVVDRLDAGAHGVDLARQPRQPFASVRLGPRGGEVRAFGLGGEPFPLGQLGAVGLEAFPRLGELVQQVAFVCGDLFGFGLQRVRVRTRG